MKIYLAMGEPSGDALAADLVDELRRRDTDIEFFGLAGVELQRRGLSSLFDMSELSIMGISAVVQNLPSLIRRVYQTVDDIVRVDPDVLIVIDAPDFTHAVAKRVRKRAPHIRIVNYVCPSVWAWRSGRAKDMRAYIDLVLAILPFEPETMARLEGPRTVYVGHPLAEVAERPVTPRLAPRRLLVLPGSRTSVVKRMLPIFADAVARLRTQDDHLIVEVPTPGRILPLVQSECDRLKMSCTVMPANTFTDATAALATSGTVSLELAVRGIPMVLAYKVDRPARLLTRFVNTWSTALPNLIAGTTVVPENLEQFARPERLARQLEPLLHDTPVRAAQEWGLQKVRGAVRTEQPASAAAAERILSLT